MTLTSSYDEIHSSSSDINYDPSESEESVTRDIYSSYDTELPLIEEKASNEVIVDNDPVEEFVSDREDAFSDVSDFSQKESIYDFSQSQRSAFPILIDSAQATQEVEIPKVSMDNDVEYVYSTQEAKGEEENFEFRGKPKGDDIDAGTTDIIGPESFLYSAKTSQVPSQQTEDPLHAALSIIKRDLEDFAKWQRDVDWKINRFGTVINAFHNDDSVHILRVSKSWIENSLVFARCSMLEKEQVEAMIQSSTQGQIGSMSTENDTVQDFPEPLPPPVVPSVNDAEVDVLFAFSFAMKPNCSIEAMESCKVVAVWEPTFDIDGITLPDYPDTSSISTITRFKIVA